MNLNHCVLRISVQPGLASLGGTLKPLRAEKGRLQDPSAARRQSRVCTDHFALRASTSVKHTGHCSNVNQKLFAHRKQN